jgi:hypothetical protein
LAALCVACAGLFASSSAVALATPAGAQSAALLAHPDQGGQPTTATIVNGDSEGATIRFDTAGNAIDAHDGAIARFGDTYYLYGTSYGCGFTWGGPGTPFCGFRVYTSTDLSHWRYVGPLFDATTATWQKRCNGSTYGCFRPHVVYNATTHRYVMWVNSYDNTVDYHVFTALRPTGPFVEQPAPRLAINQSAAPTGVNNGDENLFVDTDGTAYLAYTDWIGAGDIVVEQLNQSYLSGTGRYVRLNTRSTEAPSLFKRGSTYYMTYSDPNCGYCAGTGTSYLTAPSPLGPWTGSSAGQDTWQVSDGMLKVTGGDIGLSKAGADWTDYTMSFDTVPLQTGDGGSYAQAGWVFRAKDTGTGYAWLLGNYPYAGAESGSLTKVVFDNGAVVSDTVVPLPFAVVGGDTYHVSTTVSGSTITTTVNGVTVDTTTDTKFGSGRVGFREGSSDGESALFDNLVVTAPDGSVLLADDFSSGLANWDRPAPVVKGTSISTTSCGGQPDNVATLNGADGRPVYLYQSDRWNGGASNQALATQFWEPLQFNADGSIQQLTCADSYQVQLSGPQAPAPKVSAGAGDVGFHSYCDVGGNIERAQTFTAQRSGVLSGVAYTTYQSGNPNAPLTLSLERLDSAGLPDGVVTSQTVPTSQVSWSPSWVYLRSPISVQQGERLALVASSSTTQGCYGLAYNDTNPYPGGGEFYSNNGGQSWSAESGRDLHFRILMSGTAQ